MSRHSIIVFCIFCIFALTPQVSAGDRVRLAANQAKNYFLYYTWNDDVSMTFEISVINKGWIGLAFNPDANTDVNGAEALRCWYTDATKASECAGYKGGAGGALTLDPGSTIQVISGGYDPATQAWNIKIKKTCVAGGVIDDAITNNKQIKVFSALASAMGTKDVFDTVADWSSVSTKLVKTLVCVNDCQAQSCDGASKEYCLFTNKFLLYRSASFVVEYKLYPSISFENIQIEVKGKNSGYVLIAFGNSTFAPGADAILINYDSAGKGACTDVKIIKANEDEDYELLNIVNDKQNDCSVVSFTPRTADGNMDIIVTRKLNTGDAEDFKLEINKPTDFAITNGPSDTFDYFRQLYSLQKYVLFSRDDQGPQCTFGCPRYSCSGPEENQCLAGCVFGNDLLPTCKAPEWSWTNRVQINSNYTLLYNYNGKSLSLALSGFLNQGWLGLAFGYPLKSTNILILSLVVDISGKLTIQESGALTCSSYSIESATVAPKAISGTTRACGPSSANSYQSEGGFYVEISPELTSANPSEYKIELDKKQTWSLVIGKSTDITTAPDTVIPIPEFTLSSTKIECDASCAACTKGQCTQCAKGKQVFNNVCVNERSENWNYFTISAKEPIEAAYTLYLPHDGTNYLSTTQGFIQLNFTGTKLGWLGLGIGLSMEHSDLFAIHKNGDTWVCSDMFSEELARPEFDEWLAFGQNNCELISVDTSTAGKFTASIRRPMNMVDSFDYSIVKDTLVNFIWAVNTTTSTLMYHGDTEDGFVGRFTLNITNAKLCHPDCKDGCSGPTKTECLAFEPCKKLNYIKVDNNFNLYYYYCNDQIIFRAFGYSPGWFGVGYEEGMTNVDMNVISFDANGKAICTDYWSTGEIQPKTDVSQGGTNDCTIISGNRTKDGIIDVWFSRPINATNSKLDYEFVDTKDKVFSFAFGKTDSFDQHVSFFISEVKMPRQTCTLENCGTCPQIQSCLCSAQNKLALTSDFSLYYQICQDNVLFRALGQSPGWFGLGFGKGMTNVDMLMINFKSSVATCTDLWSKSAAMPSEDVSLGGTNDCKILNGTRDTSGKMDVFFYRPLKATNQGQDTEFKVGTQDLSFAFGASDTFAQHKSADSKNVIINSTQVCATVCSTCSGPDVCLSCKTGYKLNSSSCVADSNNTNGNYAGLLILTKALLLLLVVVPYLV